MAKLELYGTARCPHTQEMREWLEWQRRDFVEYDVEADPDARQRMRVLAAGQRSVPVLVEDGKLVSVEAFEGDTDPSPILQSIPDMTTHDLSPFPGPIQ